MEPFTVHEGIVMPLELRGGDAIAAYEQRHASAAPWLTVAGTS